MKNKLLLLTILMNMVGIKAFAYYIAVENADGVTIYYNYINDGKELEVTGGSYSGVVAIPEEVTFMNRTRKVTAIGNNAFSGSASYLKSVIMPNSITIIGNEAFYDCNSITSISIPNSVTTIGNEAFKFCSSLSSVTIPNSVITIGERAFEDCSSLTSVTIPNSVSTIGNRAFMCCGLTSVTIPNSITSLEGTFCCCTNLTSISIPNSVTFIGDGAFNGCDNLTSVTIPNSVTTIGDDAFSCSGLTSITIPNSVTYIEVGYESAFGACPNLTSIVVENDNSVYDSREKCNAIIETATNNLVQGCKNTVIPNSITSIGAHAFESCNLTSVTIPNSVTSIDSYAFGYCRSLTSVTIPNSVTTIGSYAFLGCNDLSIVISKIDNPFDLYDRYWEGYGTFSPNTYNNATLYVPKGTIDLYKAKEGWNKFHFIEEGDGGEIHTEPSEPTEPTQCEKPTISYQNGKLLFNCVTEGATCHYRITDSDIKAGDGEEIQLNVTYNISVFATKEGCKTSETTTATLCWVDVEPKTEGINSIAQVRANAVMIKAEEGLLTIEGADDNSNISVYTIDGVQVGSTISRNGIAHVNTNIIRDSIAIVKIGSRNVKVIMK